MSPATARTHVSRAMTKLGPATAPSSSSWPTKLAWSGPAGRENIRGGNRRPGYRSGSPGHACLQSMHVAYVVITSLAVVANGYAACLNFAGAASVKAVADLGYPLNRTRLMT